jgi:putative ABC transport system permease protein
VSVLRIAWTSVRQRPLSSALTALGVALGVGLVLLVLEVRATGRLAFDDAARGYDVVLGPVHSSPLTTVLSTVFHVDAPTDVVPIEVYDAVKADKRVRFAVPMSTGDVVKGWRVVGTSEAFFDAIEDSAGRPLRTRIREGRAFTDASGNEAVVGSLVAARAGLGLGAKFHPQHGQGGHEHDEEYVVVGVLESTGTPNDRIILIPLESFFEIKGHERPATAPPPPSPAMGEEGPDEHHAWAVSAIAVRLASPLLKSQFVGDMNRRPDVQPAIPSVQISALFQTVESVDAFVRVVAWLVVLVSGIAILVGLLNSIHGRRREIAILRSLGARPAHVFGVLVAEGALLCAVGGVVGVLLAKGGVAAAAPWLLDTAGVRVSPSLSALDALALAGAVALGVLAALVPAWRALRVPVAANLHPID